jgi:hypothetical protein
MTRIEVDSDDERAELASPWAEIQRAAEHVRHTRTRPLERRLPRRVPVATGARSTKDHDLVFEGHGSNKNPLVGGTGFEPVTSSVSGKRSPAELTARRGGSGNRTRVQGFAGPCLSHSAIPPQASPCGPGRCRRAERTVGTRDGFRHLGADDGIRTRDPHLGKVMLYQLSHVRVRPRPASMRQPYRGAFRNCSRS